MEKYNNTRTVLSVSNKSAILVYIVAALTISTATIYFIAASQDYSDLLQSVSTLSSNSNHNNNDGNKDDAADAVSTTNEMIFFIIVGIIYIAAGIWMLENKYYSKIPYVIAAVGSIALIAFYIATRTINIPTIGIQDDVGTIDILSKALQAAIAGLSIYIVRTSTIVWRSVTTSRAAAPSSPAEMLEHEMQKIRRDQI
ncbi:MAG TPA: hypothetical protein VH500_25205 [Nitrososphaeraceae archaeon]|jgi:hypothetical protein